MNALELQEVVARQKRFFEGGGTLEKSFRLKALLKLQNLVQKHLDEIADALQADLGKSAFEAYATETGIVLEEIRLHIKKLYKWSAPKKTGSPLAAFPASSYLIPEPFGQCLIISPWNYPFQLAVAPLVGAISAGNCAIIKPSEYSVHTSALLERIINSNFEPGHVVVVNGDAKTSQQLLAQKHDLIFFTGSPQIGKIVMKAAAEHLTPVILELGGKSPCIIDSKVDLKLAAKRIMWGKLINAGQTCIAPDYVLLPENIGDTFIQLAQDEVRKMYGDHILENPEYPKIINQTHFNRLKALLTAVNKDELLRVDSSKLKIAPVILRDPSIDSPVMQEEIFGPILPVVSYRSLEEAFQFVKARPKPLALYLFSNNKKTQKRVVTELSAGGICINDTIMHFTNARLPFGGIGNSGMGSYHGKHSFDAFTHFKPVLHRWRWPDIPLRYPPFRNKLNLVKKILR